MAKLSRRRLARTVVGLLRERPGERRQIMQMLAAYLVVHKQHKQWDLMLLDIAHELGESEGHIYAEVSSAFPLDAAARKELETYLRQATGATAVELDERVDESLLAGIVVRTADQELDTSARAKLSQLSSLHVNTPKQA